MRQIADDPSLERLRRAMRHYLDRPEFEEPTFKCGECKDVLFVPDLGGGFRKCMFGRCPAWDGVKEECDHQKAARQTRKRKVEDDDIPF